MSPDARLSPDLSLHSRAPSRLRRKATALSMGLMMALSPLALAACNDVRSDAPGPEVYINSCKNMTNGYQRAGSVLMATMFKPGQEINSINYLNFGHGGLFEKDNTLWLITTKHSFGDLKEGQYLTAEFCGANGKTYTRDITSSYKQALTFSEEVEHKVTTTSKEDEHKEITASSIDSLVAFPLIKNNDDLSSAIEAKEIIPLKIKSVNTLDQGQSLGIISPKGDFTKISHVDSGNTPNSYPSGQTLDPGYEYVNLSEGDELCKGQSGAPILVLNENNNLTGEAVGELARGGVQKESPSLCSVKYVLFIPFNVT